MAGSKVAWKRPRALGNRSILADPRNIESRDKVNAVVKFREFWRPFCPSMTPEGAKKYLINVNEAPFMIVTFDATEIAYKEIPAVVHTDGTSRVQVVKENHNKLYYNLIREFEKLRGCQSILNKSMKIKVETIVCSVHDAIRTFYGTGLDALDW